MPPGGASGSAAPLLDVEANLVSGRAEGGQRSDTPGSSHGSLARAPRSAARPLSPQPPQKKTEKREAYLKCLPVFLPQRNPWLDMWDLVMMLTLVQMVFLTPYELAFIELRLDGLFLLNRVIDLIFVTDMGLRFITAAPSKSQKGGWITDPDEIAVTYLTGWFTIDFLSILPFDWYCLWVSSAEPDAAANRQNLDDLDLLRMGRALRLARLTHGARIMQRWRTSVGIRNWLMSLFEFLALLILCCHWNACLWGGIGLRGTGEITWLKAVHTAKGGPAELYSDERSVYILSVYWTIMTLTGVGYGDITPQTSLEYKAALLCMTVMAATWAYVIGEVCAIVATLSPHEVNFKRLVDDLNWLLDEWNVDHATRRRIREYFWESKHMQRHALQKAILGHMSPMLQTELLRGSKEDWMQQVRFLRDVADHARVRVVQQLRQRLFAPGEQVAAGRIFFIVRRGVCSRRGKVLTTGDHWGEDFILHNPVLRHPEHASALGYLELSMLYYADVAKIAEDHEPLQRAVHKARKYIALSRAVTLMHRMIRELSHVGMLGSHYNADERMALTAAMLGGLFDANFCSDASQLNRLARMLEQARSGQKAVWHEAMAASGSFLSEGTELGSRPSRSWGVAQALAVQMATIPSGVPDDDAGIWQEVFQSEASELLDIYSARVQAVLSGTAPARDYLPEAN